MTRQLRVALLSGRSCCLEVGEDDSVQQILQEAEEIQSKLLSM